MSKESFTLAEYKPVEYDHVSLNRTYIDHLTKYGNLPFIITLLKENVKVW